MEVLDIQEHFKYYVDAGGSWPRGPGLGKGVAQGRPGDILSTKSRDGCRQIGGSEET